MECGGPQGPASTEDEGGDLVVARFGRWIKLDQLLSLRDPDSVRFSSETQGFLPVDLHLVRDHKFRLGDGLGSQELLGTGAARSTLSVVVPFDIGGHWISKLMGHLSCE